MRCQLWRNEEGRWSPHRDIKNGVHAEDPRGELGNDIQVLHVADGFPGYGRFWGRRRYLS